eukprot:364254-Chlamydomonas_euryale.AAC.14
MHAHGQMPGGLVMYGRHPSCLFVGAQKLAAIGVDPTGTIAQLYTASHDGTVKVCATSCNVYACMHACMHACIQAPQHMCTLAPTWQRCNVVLVHM